MQQDTGSKTLECSAAQPNCQDLAERDCALSQALMANPERLSLAPSLVCLAMAHLSVPPPERPPRLQA